MLLELVMLCAWTALVVYVSWFFSRAKTVHPLTLDDLALTWKVHKQQKGCNASRIHSLLKENDDVVGFKCDCGFEFIQKRLITQRSPGEWCPRMCGSKGWTRKPVTFTVYWRKNRT